MILTIEAANRIRPKRTFTSSDDFVFIPTLEKIGGMLGLKGKFLVDYGTDHILKELTEKLANRGELVGTIDRLVKDNISLVNRIEESIKILTK